MWALLENLSGLDSDFWPFQLLASVKADTLSLKPVKGPEYLTIETQWYHFHTHPTELYSYIKEGGNWQSGGVAENKGISKTKEHKEGWSKHCRLITSVKK